jgi:hypothetical protein
VVPEQEEEEKKTLSDERIVGTSESKATSISRRNNLTSPVSPLSRDSC